MNSPNYPPPGGGQQGPYGQPPQGQQPYGQRPPQTPPGGQPYGGPGGPGGPSGPGGPGGGPGGPGPAGPPQGQPYGAPPPQGQPYGGQPPQTPPGGQPPQGYPTPPPPEPGSKPKGKGTVFKIVGGLVVVAIIVVAVIYFQGKSASSAAVGDCIKVNNASATNADVEKIDCNTKEAVYKVAVTKDDSAATCPGGAESNYVSYTEEGSLLLCLTLNAKEGECFESTASDDKRVECSAATASFKVAKVITGQDDPAGCGEGADDAITYPEPKLTLCLAAPDAA